MWNPWLVFGRISEEYYNTYSDNACEKKVKEKGYLEEAVICKWPKNNVNLYLIPGA